MDDMISRAAAIFEIGKLIKEYRENEKDEMADGMIIARRYGIKQLPAVDAVPVVRCKDCGYFQTNNAEEGDWSGRCTNVYVPMNGTTVDGWWFCADGERRDIDA